ncbi:MAG TPA: DUF1440 domain-containing protein [Vicinamibacterales bacterium]
MRAEMAVSDRPREEGASARPGTRLVRQAVLGAAAGVLAGLVMNQFARAVSAATGGREAESAAPGSDRTGRGVQPPQAAGRSHEDAAVRMGARVYRAATGREPRRRDRPLLGSLAHVGFGASAGACYAVLADGLPFIRFGHGTLYGTAVWAVADELVTPALGLSRGPRELGPGVHAYALAGHWVYGAALETVRRLGSRQA